MKSWILVAIAVALLVWGLVREPFEATQRIKAPPYDEAEEDRIWAMLSEKDQNIARKSIHEDIQKVSPATMVDERIVIGRPVMMVVGFYFDVYKPASAPITQQQIDDYVAGKSSGDIRGVYSRLLSAYFIKQGRQGGSASDGYAKILKEMGQGGVNTQTGTAAGGTTGGSSVTSAAPNSGSTSNRKVFGPVYTSKAAPVSGSRGADTSTTNQYPELLGGGLPDTSVRTPCGIQNPSQSWLLSQSGALPSTASLGSDANSCYLPTSRSPGDQDLIPDPYRLARNYSTASYSSKTDPVPFLTDFSAFLK